MIPLAVMFSKKREPERVTPPSTPCPDCGGERVEVAGSMEMYLVHRSGGRPVSELIALVCLRCGRVHFYADRLDKIRDRASS
ncbi:hypothetical protein [Nocardia sp. R7R-8]|uniref:hypothetical protein n=1 Tax=Nocardia sp. R7R-8 TaxID=3459304 RepID=UPI00403DB4F0